MIPSYCNYVLSRLQVSHYPPDCAERYSCGHCYFAVCSCEELRPAKNCEYNFESCGIGNSSSLNWRQVGGSSLAKYEEIESGKFNVGISCSIEEEELHLAAPFRRLRGNVRRDKEQGRGCVCRPERTHLCDHFEPINCFGLYEKLQSSTFGLDLYERIRSVSSRSATMGQVRFQLQDAADESGL